MSEKLEQLVAALRNELQHYGELLALFEAQQEHLVRRDADQVLGSVARINALTSVVQDARRDRVHRLQDLAESLSVPPDGQLTTLLPALPGSRRAQIQALMTENNRLLARIQTRARQNHSMLSHSLEHMNRFIHALVGAKAGTVVYDGVGSVAAAAIQTPSIYEAVG